MGCFGEYIAVSGPPSSGQVALGLELASLIQKERNEEVALVANLKAAQAAGVVPPGSSAPKFWELSSMLPRDRTSTRNPISMLEDCGARLTSGAFLIDSDRGGFESEQSPQAGTNVVKFISNGCRLFVEMDEQLHPQTSPIGYTMGWEYVLWVIKPIYEHLTFSARVLNSWRSIEGESSRQQLKKTTSMMLESMKIVVNDSDMAGGLPRADIEDFFRSQDKPVRHFLPRKLSTEELGEKRSQALHALVERIL